MFNPSDVKEIEKYGKTVWCHGKMDGMRKINCLCLHCALLEDCDEAYELLKFSIDHNMAMAITRCPNWERVSE